MSSLVGQETQTMSSTGAMKGVKPEKFDLIPQWPVRVLARWYGCSPVDFSQAISWQPVLNYAESHLNDFWFGVDVDEITGLSPLASAAAAFAHLVETENRFETLVSVESYRALTLIDRTSARTALLSKLNGLASRSEDSNDLRFERFDLIPTRAMLMLARHYGAGALKYAAHNWAGGYEWSKSFASLSRHLTQAKSGEYIDEETGSPHMVSVLWHCLNLIEYQETHPEFDDRPVRGTSRTRMSPTEG